MAAQHVFWNYAREAVRPTARRYRYCPLCAATLDTGAAAGRAVCPACGWVHYRNPSPGVAALIVRDGQVLLGQRARGFGAGQWCLPGGFIEYDEDYLAAAVREVHEETGLRVAMHAIVNVASNFLSPDLHTLAVVLLAEIVDGEAAPGDDISALAWFPLGAPLPPMAFAADRHIIECYAAGGLAGLPVAE